MFLQKESGKGMTTDIGAFSPGTLVRHPDCPEWGLGQVQSEIGSKVSVNFEHVGKKVINTAYIKLIFVFEE